MNLEYKSQIVLHFKSKGLILNIGRNKIFYGLAASTLRLYHPTTSTKGMPRANPTLQTFQHPYFRFFKQVDNEAKTNQGSAVHTYF